MRRLSQLSLIASFIVSAPAVAQAQTIYPVDQAQILAGARFDFKVELPERVAQGDIRITVNGADYAAASSARRRHISRKKTTRSSRR